MSLAVDVVFWALTFIGTALLLFSMVYDLVLFGDLARDHVNPIELCELVNRLVPFEYGGHVVLTLLFLLRGYFWMATIQIPLIAFHVRRYQSKSHLLDNTAVFSDMPREQRVETAKLVFYMLNFFAELVLFIIYLID